MLLQGKPTPSLLKLTIPLNSLKTELWNLHFSWKVKQQSWTRHVKNNTSWNKSWPSTNWMQNLMRCGKCHLERAIKWYLKYRFKVIWIFIFYPTVDYIQTCIPLHFLIWFISVIKLVSTQNFQFCRRLKSLTNMLTLEKQDTKKPAYRRTISYWMKSRASDSPRFFLVSIPNSSEKTKRFAQL